MMLDFIIVGQGVAGTVLSYLLLQKNQRIAIIDDGHKSSASKSAAGIVNPITGRYYTKSWMVDTLIPEARKLYRDMEQELGISMLKDRNVLRTLPNAQTENRWYNRMDNPAYVPYMEEQFDLGEFAGIIHQPFAGGEIKNGMQVDLTTLLDVFRSVHQNIFVEGQFDFHQLMVNQEKIEYGDLQSRGIIFCEGYRVVDNPYFSYLPFDPVKGEALLIKIGGPMPDKILRDKQFICPVSEDQFWIGSGYDKSFEDVRPTEVAKEKLVEFLDGILKVPYEITDHVAGVRPSVVDRRPLIGRHPEYKPLWLFNGMGTKGTSLAPYWAQQLIDHMLHNTELSSEVNLDRYPMPDNHT